MSFYRLITDAVNDIMRNGYSRKRMDGWLERIGSAAEASLTPISVIERTLHLRLLKVFTRATSDKTLLRVHQGISHYTLQSIKPKLHALLEDRIRASADLIKLHREESVARTLSRFAGWASSVPSTGTDVGKRTKVRQTIRKAISGLPYEERRVIVDQGHKLVAAVNEVVAIDGGAVAMRWHSHWREANYDYRPKHKERDNVIYVVRGNWMLRDGLMKLAGYLYTDEITQVGEEVFCRCYAEYLYSPRDLPVSMLTEKCKTKLADVRAQIAAWGQAA